MKLLNGSKTNLNVSNQTSVVRRKLQNFSVLSRKWSMNTIFFNKISCNLAKKFIHNNFLDITCWKFQFLKSEIFFDLKRTLLNQNNLLMYKFHKSFVHDYTLKDSISEPIYSYIIWIESIFIKYFAANQIWMNRLCLFYSTGSRRQKAIRCCYGLYRSIHWNLKCILKVYRLHIPSVFLLYTHYLTFN